MRQTQASSNGDFNAKAIAGTHTVLIALNCKDQRRKDLKGFAFQREVVGPGGTGPKWLRSQKVFKSVVPDPEERARSDADPTKPARFYTDDFPIQSFLWGDYAAAPGHAIPLPHPADVRQARRAHHRPAGRDRRRDHDREGMAPGRDARRVVQPRRHREPEVRRGVRQQGAAEHQRSGGSGQSNGCRAACSKPAWNTSTRPSRAMRCGSPPTNSPIRRSSTRFKALLDKGIDVQIVYHDTTDARAAQRNSDEGGRPSDQRPEDHLPALEDEDPAQQVHRPSQERHRSGRGVDGLDQLHALRLPRPDQCRPSHRRRRHRQAVFRVLEGREDRSGTGRCARPSSWR